jgi:hypothetical protein
VAGLPADTAGLQTGYPGARAPQVRSTVMDLEVPLPITLNPEGQD